MHRITEIRIKSTENYRARVIMEVGEVLSGAVAVAESKDELEHRNGQMILDPISIKKRPVRN